MNDLLQSSLHGPAIYNPGWLAKEELVRTFVARQDLLQLLTDDLQRALSGGSPQHHLILGQRGMGKTTLLHRIRYAVDDDPGLSKAWLPLTFEEEQNGAIRLSDFYLSCVDALIDTLETRGHDKAAQALDKAVATIPRHPEKERAEHALDLLIGTAKKHKAQLLLLIDNIDLLFRRLSEHEWTLRELLSSQTRLCVIGASAAPIEATYEYGKAFYDFFQVHALCALNDEECRKVLLALSAMFKTPRVEKWLHDEPGRLRTLRLLTGGNPRTVALLHSVAASESGGDVLSDLKRLLDDVTPLYKHRFEALPDQAQRVVHALALHWRPASAADLAEATQLGVNAVSSQLNRLVNDGLVEKVPFFPETKTGFQIGERFFNIWYLMRSSRRARRSLGWLVEFLKMFYDAEELRGHAHSALRGPGRKAGDDGANALSTWEDLYIALNAQGRYVEATDAARRLTELAPEVAWYWNELAWSLYFAGQTNAQAERAAREAARLDPAELAFACTAATILTCRGDWAEACDFVLRLLKDDSPPSETWVTLAIFFREAVQQGHAEDAEAMLDKTETSKRWMPLREALRVIVASNPLLLRRLAPEVREPAQRLIHFLTSPDLPIAPATKQSVSPAASEPEPQKAAPKAKKTSRKPEPASQLSREHRSRRDSHQPGPTKARRPPSRTQKSSRSKQAPPQR